MIESISHRGCCESAEDFASQQCALCFDFVSSTTPGAGSALTSADRTKIRSRAARNDPFSDRLVRVSKSRKKPWEAVKPRSQLDIVERPKSYGLQKSVNDSRASPAPCHGSSHPELWTPFSPWELVVHNPHPDYFPFQSQDPLSGPFVPVTTTDPDRGDDLQHVHETNCVTQELENQWSGPSLQPYHSAARIDPFWTFPIEFRSNLPALIHHYLNFLAPHQPGLDSFWDERLLLRWFAIGTHEPAHLYSTLAFAAAHFIDAGGRSVKKEDVLYLKHSAITSINRALTDPRKALTQSLIASIMVLAAFEFAFGDTKSYEAHVAGWRKMIALRGGMETLEPWLVHFLK